MITKEIHPTKLTLPLILIGVATLLITTTPNLGIAAASAANRGVKSVQNLGEAIGISYKQLTQNNAVAAKVLGDKPSFGRRHIVQIEFTDDAMEHLRRLDKQGFPTTFVNSKTGNLVLIDSNMTKRVFPDELKDGQHAFVLFQKGKNNYRLIEVQYPQGQSQPTLIIPEGKKTTESYSSYVSVNRKLERLKTDMDHLKQLHANRGKSHLSGGQATQASEASRGEASAVTAKTATDATSQAKKPAGASRLEKKQEIRNRQRAASDAASSSHVKAEQRRRTASTTDTTKERRSKVRKNLKEMHTERMKRREDAGLPVDPSYTEAQSTRATLEQAVHTSKK